jgi:hypothetical protein
MISAEAVQKIRVQMEPCTIQNRILAGVGTDWLGELYCSRSSL